MSKEHRRHRQSCTLYTCMSICGRACVGVRSFVRVWGCVRVWAFVRVCACIHVFTCYIKRHVGNVPLGKDTNDTTPRHTLEIQHSLI